MKSFGAFLLAIIFFNINVFGQLIKPIKKPIYLFSYFKNNGADGLHLAYSKNGFNWQSLQNDSSVLQPMVGIDKLMRDPCIIRGTDGLFHMTWTVSWKERTIGYASSSDLVHWSTQQNIPVMMHEPTAKNCWAPEIFYDDANENYMFYWSTTIPGAFPETEKKIGNNNHRIYFTTTKDFKTFTNTKLLWKGNCNVIDATIQKIGNKYCLFMKDETERPDKIKRIYMLTSDKLTEGYGELSAPAITIDYNAEGPTLVKVKKEWLLYFDKPLLHQYGAFSSTNLHTWVDVSEKITIPKGLRHGSIITITQKEFKRLRFAISQKINNN
jgi:hypothetical protein